MRRTPCRRRSGRRVLPTRVGVDRIDFGFWIADFGFSPHLGVGRRRTEDQDSMSRNVASGER